MTPARQSPAMSQTDTAAFDRGAAWVRADFHLHTRSDKQFTDSGDATDFAGRYIAALVEAQIKVGVITNHNKFNVEEFRSLRKAAADAKILLLPGIELSVKEGGNGVHTLVVFGDAWLEGNGSLIQQFLGSTFAGRTPQAYENEGARSDDDLMATIKRLEAYEKDYFLVFAHVEQKSGFWSEVAGGLMTDIAKKELYQKRTLAFQKFRTHNGAGKGVPCRTKVQEWLEGFYPAEVEGSDPKAIGEIGKGKKCFIKIGELTFESVKFALHDWRQRVSGEMEAAAQHARLHGISFKGGLLDGQSFSLSEQLTCLIGSRGSGKSSVVECLRYGLGLEPGESDLKYKNGLISGMLANGGEVSVTGKTSEGFDFEVRRPLGYEPVVRLEGKDTRLRPIDILPGLLYFGQKDLGHRHPGFEDDLFLKLTGRRAVDERSLEEQRIAAVRRAVDAWHSVQRASEKEQEYAQEEERLGLQLAVYREKGVEKQLERLTTFDADKRNLAEFIGHLQALRRRLEPAQDDWDEIGNDWPVLKSGILSDLGREVLESQNEFAAIRADHAAVLARMDGLLAKLREVLKQVMEKERDLQEEFAALQREIDAPGLNLEEFRARKSRHEQLVKLLKSAGNRQEMSTQALTQVEASARALHDLWREWHRQEFQELSIKSGPLPPSLRLSIQFEGNREEFRNFLKSRLSGTGFRAVSIDKLVDEFTNGFTLFQRRSEIDRVLGGSADVAKCHSLLFENLAEVLTFRVPDKRFIWFNEVPIQDLSLGQRATALLQLLMSLEDHPVFLIDQPEDDLDNETIFRHVVEPLLEGKARSQFIIATHNPNIPVLGDAELVHACRERDKGHYDHSSGSLDSSTTREAIVAIMEGGAQAFEQRQKIYSQWTNLL